MGDLQEKSPVLQDLSQDGSTIVNEDREGGAVLIDDDVKPEGENVDVDVGEGQPEEKPKKKKSKGKKKSKSKKKKITGFEESYDDGPITPAVFEEEKKLYDPEIPVTDRLQTAIQRYQTKRTMDNERLHIFKNYMEYGGVNTKSKMFGGLDQKDLKDLDSEEIIQARTTCHIPENRLGWKIDFETVVKGFLSSCLPEFFALDTPELVAKSTGVVRNFLNYLLYHNVCPEHSSNILAARNVVDRAQQELWKVHQATLWAPGDFNMACSTLFGGEFMESYTGDSEWRKEAEDNFETEGVRGMPDNVARKVVMFAIAGAGTEEQALRFRDLATRNEVKVVKVEGVSAFEVTEVIEPDEEVKEFYAENAPDLQVVGKLRARAWTDPSEPEEDHPPEYYEKQQQQLTKRDSEDACRQFEFFVDEGLFRHCFVGMKFTADVWEMLDCGGIYYFDNVISVLCSFFTVLDNGLLDGWKEPRELVKENSDDEGVDDANDDDGDDPDKRPDEAEITIEA